MNRTTEQRRLTMNRQENIKKFERLFSLGGSH